MIKQTQNKNFKKWSFKNNRGFQETFRFHLNQKKKKDFIYDKIVFKTISKTKYLRSQIYDINN